MRRQVWNNRLSKIPVRTRITVGGRGTDPGPFGILITVGVVI
jgi:hypothetical protein